MPVAHSHPLASSPTWLVPRRESLADEQGHRLRPLAPRPTRPAVGIGYRWNIDEWTRANLARFDVLEVTLDHCLAESEGLRAAIFDLVGRIPLTAVADNKAKEVQIDVKRVEASAKSYNQNSGGVG